MHCLWPFSEPWGDGKDKMPCSTSELGHCWKEPKAWKRKQMLALWNWTLERMDGGIRVSEDSDGSKESGTKRKSHIRKMKSNLWRSHAVQNFCELSCRPAVTLMVITFYFIFTFNLWCQDSAGQLCVVPIEMTLHYVPFHVFSRQKKRSLCGFV